MSARAADGDVLPRGPVRVPEHVVCRDFSAETVMLNLTSGQYHSLNRTAARMLDALATSTSPGQAVQRLSRELGQPPEVIRRDLVELYRSLEQRGLIEAG